MMSLFGDLAEKAATGLMGSSSNPLVHSAFEMIQNQPGGLDGLVQNFQQKGLGEVVSSWVSTGQNLPISADQITHVLGSDTVKNLAAKAGISPDQAGSQLAALLPGLIDKLTPNGHTGDAGGLLATAMNALKPHA
jgi:uncharacterized protein YidB (DUF937 family)